MDTVKSRLLIQCVAQHIARELHDIIRSAPTAAERRAELIEHCLRTRSLLKRVKKLLSWARTHYLSYKKAMELSTYLLKRASIYKECADTLAVLHGKQLSSLRTAPFAMQVAGDLLCRGEYCGYPLVGAVQPTPASLKDKVTRLMRHKALLLSIPQGVKLE